MNQWLNLLFASRMYGRQMTIGELSRTGSVRQNSPVGFRIYGSLGVYLPPGICLALFVARAGGPGTEYLLTACLLTALSAWIIRREHAIDDMAAQLSQCLGQELISGGYRLAPMGRLASAIKNTAAQLDLVRHRLPQRHPITGMDTREVLIEMIDRCPPGESPRFLGVIEMLDFDRICAFDAPSAEQLLTAIAARLVSMVGPDRSIAQIDRARFAIWFSAMPVKDAKKEFDALCYAMRSQVTADTIDLLPQFACGFACDESERISAAELLTRAVSDLGSATKSAQGETVDPTVAARQRFTFEQGLRRAIERHEFKLMYQPFIRADQQRVCGAEALLRWHSAEHGLISPAVFIPIVEAVGLAEEVGLWVLNEACEEAAHWGEIGLRNIKVAVNLSALQLSRDDFDMVVQRLLKRHGMSSSALELELTESVAAEKSQRISTLFQRLRALGVSMSIDDFGTGYSSLSYLKNLKFDKLKIDREFVSGVDRQSDSQAICQSIIALGRGLGIEVLAEGVETWDEYAWLRRHGCPLFQGYYFSKPLTPKAFVAFARDTKTIGTLTDVGPTALHDHIYEKLA
jgi:EAL domain-containing protein (putative c-di-GMP-specific phosphodiesterase class I)/GGDEF domain-containing protein